jgi:transcriptional regulator with XRE-family HTH domain
MEIGKSGERNRVRKKATGSAETVHINTFAYNLRRARMEAGLSQSDLARKIWGTTKNNEGYIVARNRGRISAYEKGAQEPAVSTLKEIAEALGKTAAELAPGLIPKDDDSEALSMTMIEGQPGRVHLKVNVLTTLELAAKIIGMLSVSEKGSRGR